MKIEIKRWDDEKIIICGEYESVRDCLQKNSSANLSYANLCSANLSYANLCSANLRSANLSYANLSFANLCSANLRYANLRYANLRYANLCSADLRSANLCYANLCYANLRFADLCSASLRSAKGYVNSHEVFREVIRQQKLEIFTDKEWSIIGQILVHKLCWDSIRKRYNKKVIPVFKKLSDIGFKEWLEKYKEDSL